MGLIHQAQNTAEVCALLKEDKLKELDVHPHAEMGDQGATQLADSLRQNQLLEVLILGSQKIGPDGAEAIGKALQKHQALRELHLHKNNLGYHGVERMARAMAEAWTERSSRPGNKIIKVLVLRHNGIAPCCGDCTLCRGQSDFPMALLELSSVETLDLNANGMTALPLELPRALPRLHWLDVRDNPLANVPERVFLTARKGHAGTDTGGAPSPAASAALTLKVPDEVFVSHTGPEPSTLESSRSHRKSKSKRK